MRIGNALGLMVGCTIAVLLQSCEPADAPEADPSVPTATATPNASAIPPTSAMPQSSVTVAPTPAAQSPIAPGAMTAAQSPIAPGGMTVAQTPIAPGGMALAQTPIAPGGATKKGEPAFDTNLVKNGSFEALRDDNTPRGWAQTDGLVAGADGPAKDGDHALTLTSVDGQFGLLTIGIPVDEADLGKTIEASAWAISKSHWKLSMLLIAMRGDEKVTLERKGWEAKQDKWQQGALSFQLPDDIDPSSLALRFLVADEPGLTFQLDDVRAFVATVGNGSFENKDEEGRPRGWALNPVEAIRTADLVAPFDGDSLLSLESVGDQWTVLAAPLEVRADDLGRELTVAAQTRAPIDHGLFIDVRCDVNGEEQILGRTPCPSSEDAWTQITSILTLPKDADPESVQLRITLRDEPGQRFYIDDVQAKFQ